MNKRIPIVILSLWSWSLPAAALPASPQGLARVVADLSTQTSALRAAKRDAQAFVSKATTASPGLKAAALDFPKVRDGLTACFASPAEGECAGEKVQALRAYTKTLEQPLREELEAKLRAVDAARKALEALKDEASRLQADALRARQDVERVVQDAYYRAVEIDENPLEAARAKAEAIEAWKAAAATRSEVQVAAIAADREARAMATWVDSVRASTLQALSTFGAAR